jgi:hypothetical protein
MLLSLPIFVENASRNWLVASISAAGARHWREILKPRGSVDMLAEG